MFFMLHCSKGRVFQGCSKTLLVKSLFGGDSISWKRQELSSAVSHEQNDCLSHDGASCGHGCVLWEAVEGLCLSVSLRQGIHLGNSRALVWHPASNTPLEFGVLSNLEEPPPSLSVLTSVAVEPWLSSGS